jgi:hypothetical protein
LPKPTTLPKPPRRRGGGSVDADDDLTSDPSPDVLIDEVHAEGVRGLRRARQLCTVVVLTMCAVTVFLAFAHPE